MSSPLDKKEKAEETKYARNADFEFKIIARRNKLLGLWVADILGLTKEDAESLAKETVMSDFEEPGDQDVLRKVVNDLKKATDGFTEDDVRKKMDDLLVTAKSQIESEGS